MVRLSLALAARLDEGEPARRARLRSDETAERQAQKEAQSRAADEGWDAWAAERQRRRDLVVEVAAQAMEQVGADEDEVLTRIEECFERLREGERDFDVTVRSIGAVVAKLCEAMGFEPDWSVWAGEEWAVEEAETNAWGSPYARDWVGYECPPDVAAEPDRSEPDGGSP